MKAHLLIVDDDPDNCFLLEQMLKKQYRVTSVNSGEEALSHLEETRFDAVLLDIMMPKMNGMELLKLIREQVEIMTLPIIMVSALSDSKHIADGLKLGANDYITKPIDRQIAMARIETQLTLKRLQDKHEQTIVELSNAQMIRDRIFRVASHDLKNPLANIRMAEFVLRDCMTDDPVATQMMDTVSVSLDAMQEVIEDLMDVVVLQSGKIDLEMKDVVVEQIVYNSAIQYNISTAQKNIALRIEDTKATVVADPARLTQVVNNLLSNAIKYSPQHTTISLWTENMGDRVRLNIADQGPGILPEERHLLFTEFGRVSNRPTAQENSTGLGLWIVKNLVELMQGTVGVEFPADGGSIFWVEFPAGKNKNQDAA
ncbi:MAG: response regulator [Aggregatilineales bacterium]